tara:strand:+ start:1919 stop:2119 length:201 start_codon:yes stop_codon:yes gene_type:complete
MLAISISIGDVSTDISTDVVLSFDAIESLLSRAVTSTLQSYLALPERDRMASLGLDTDDLDDDEDD